jgi:hypothetical protein
VLGSALFWAIVAAVAAVVAVIVSIVLYARSRQVKALAYESKSTALIRDEARDLVEILYRGSPVTNVELVTVAIGNVGNVPIRREDFETELVLDVPHAAVMLDAKVIGADPTDLKPVLTVQEHRVAIAPLLLNAGDVFELQILVTCDSDVMALAADLGEVLSLSRMSRANPPVALLTGRVVGVDAFRTSFETPAGRFLKRLAETLIGTAAVVRPLGLRF